MRPAAGTEQQPPILIFTDKAYGTGGVQTYIRMLREAAHSYLRSKGGSALCLSFLDADQKIELHSRPVDLTGFIGCAESRIGFVLRSILYSWHHRNGLVVVGYLGLAPAAWLLKTLRLIDSYVVIIYGIEAWTRRGWLDRVAISQADRVVSLSLFTAREFSKHNGYPESRIRIMAPAVNVEDRAPTQMREPKEAFKLLSVGRLTRRDRLKGFDDVLRAFHVLLAERRDVHLTIAGDGDDLPRLRRIAHELRIEDRVSFTGSVTGARLNELYRTSDVFIMLSRKEGFGLVFLEAMSFGKPCIGAGAAGAVEAIEHGVDGYLVPAEGSEIQASYIRKLIEDEDLRRTMGVHARRKIEEKHLFRHMETAWHGLFDQALGRRTC